MPMHGHTYQKWRGGLRGYSDFAHRADLIKARNKGRLGEWDGSFEQFRLTFFKESTPRHQAELVAALENVKDREIGLVLLHPEAGKTSTLETKICQWLGQNPNLRVVPVSEGQGHARKLLGKIKNRMTDVTRFGEFITRFGPFKTDGQEKQGKPWSADYIVVAKADNDERDFSIEARAVTSAAYGSRIDILLCDDIQSRRTYSQTDSILEHLRQTYLTRGRKMKVVIIGTRIGPNDVYERLVEEGLIDWMVELPAAEWQRQTLDEHDPDGTCRAALVELLGPEAGGSMGAPYSPEWWVDGAEAYEDRSEMVRDATLALAKIRSQVGEEVWAASYQQRPRSAGVQSFSETSIEGARDKTLIVGTTTGGYLVASLDPALGGGNALGVCEHGAEKLTVVDADYRFGLGRTEEILDGIANTADRYHFQVLRVEANAFQKGLGNDDRLRALAQTYGFIIEPHQTQANKHDPVLGVAAMASSMRRGEIIIPAGDPESIERMAKLVTQLRDWRPNIPTKLLRQDLVMMLWFNWLAWREHLQTLQAGRKRWSTKKRVPYSPTKPASLFGAAHEREKVA